jgi:hypothetical protein
MYCAKEILYSGDVPCVAQEEQGIGPSTLSTPLPHLPEVPIRGSVYQQPGTRVDRILSQQGGFPTK